MLRLAKTENFKLLTKCKIRRVGTMKKKYLNLEILYIKEKLNEKEIARNRNETEQAKEDRERELRPEELGETMEQSDCRE